MQVFLVIISIVIVQRLVELIVAKRNEKWMRGQGAFEAGASHYPIMVLMHVSFFITLILEVVLLHKTLSVLWIPLLLIFLAVQAGRIWCLSSLGKFWNTKIIILPNANVIKRGPYKWIRHPNYVIVTIEILVLPLIFNAFFTAFLYTALNAWMLSVRIPEEEKALREATNYSETFSLRS